MYGPSVRTACLFFLLLLPAVPALARTNNFSTKSLLGLGFRAGVENRPHSDFIVDPQTSASSYSKFYLFEPFLDFGNFVIRLSGGLHSHPTLSGKGTDSNGNFSETSDAHSVAYGIQILLVPYYSENLSQRMYIVVGGGNITTSLKNTRNYASGTSNTEKLSGSGLEYQYGAGYEFYFVQTYSIQFELGYRTLTISKFGYKLGNDLEGIARQKDDTAKSSQTGLVKKFHHDTPYFSVALNLNF
jgi:hypothetical protein